MRSHEDVCILARIRSLSKKWDEIGGKERDHVTASGRRRGLSEESENVGDKVGLELWLDNLICQEHRGNNVLQELVELCSKGCPVLAVKFG